MYAALVISLLPFISASPLLTSRDYCQDPIVQLDYAAFRGTYGKGVTKFLGMPYAASPVGPLRFKPPQPPVDQTSAGVLDATKLGNICMQKFESGPLDGYNLTPSEDCLFVNVWSPQDSFSNCSDAKTNPTAAKLPVMVWIYGGSFTSGSSSNPIFEGQRFLKEGTNQVIFVSLNYRLGAFGFLNSKEILDEGNGNIGLRDQAAALAWVRKYIHLFGGDPENVTVFGESAGGISVAAHLISGEGDQQLFQKAIIQSGGLASMLKTIQNGQPQFDTLVGLTGCTNASEGILNCLRKLPAEQLVSYYPQLLARNNFFPAVDGIFIKRHAIDAYAKNLVSKVPLLIGTNTDEGTVFTEPFVKVKEDIRPWVALNLSYGYLSKEEYAVTESLYNVSLYKAPFQAAGELVADFIFHCPTDSLTSVLSRNNVPVYQYRFNRKPLLSNVFTRGKGDLGVFHFAEVPFVFRRGLFFAPLTGEQALSDRMNEAWVRFATTGSPAPDIWPRYNTQERFQMVLQTGQLTVERDISRIEKCNFWTGRFGKRLFDTVSQTGDFISGYPFRQMPVPGTPSENDWD